MKYLDFATLDAALEKSMDKLRAMRPDAYVDGRGLPPGKVHGRGRLGKGQGWTMMLVGVEEGLKRLLGRFLVEDDAGSVVADDEIKREIFDIETVTARML